MRKLFPIAVIGATVGAVSYFINKNNKDHVAKTVSALDDLGHEAAASVNELAKNISDLPVEDVQEEE